MMHQQRTRGHVASGVVALLARLVIAAMAAGTIGGLTAPAADALATVNPTPACAGWLDTFRPPPTIRLAHVEAGVVASVTEVPFDEYVTRALATALPNPDSDEAARATAVIVKQQAWVRAINGREGFWTDPAACFDLRDDIDLPMADPTAVTATHAEAVEATRAWAMRRIDLAEPFFFPYLRDGGAGCPASLDDRQEVALTGQVEACASAGLDARDILRRLYGESVLVADVTGLGGTSRYETAANVSTRINADPPVATVYVATGADFPDAIAAGPAAARAGTALLLVTRTTIPAAVAAELTRLRPTEIRIIGGPGVIDDAVAAALGTYATVVRRISGQTRYETAIATSRAAFTGHVDAVFVATGQNFPDAVSGAAAAARLGGPVLLVPGASATTGPVATALADELGRLSPNVIHVVGGPGVVSDAWVAWLGNLAASVDRLAGVDRYATSAAVVRAVYPGTEPDLYLATGGQFPDALVAAPFGGPLLLVRPGAAAVDVGTRAAAARLEPERFFVLGTSLLIADDTLSTLVGGALPPTTDRRLAAYCCTQLPGVPLLDVDGVPMTVYSGIARYNPVQVAQWGLAHQEAWLRLGLDGDRATFLQMADWLVTHQETNGLWLYDFAFGGQPVPWRSALAEGQGVSLLLRAWQETTDDRYHVAALAAIASMHRTLAQQGVAEWDRGAYWLEEYVPPYSHHTLNGMLLAMEGLREWVLATGDPVVAAWLRDAVQTVETSLGAFDTGSWSRYNLAGTTASTKYHVIHIMLLRHFARTSMSVPMVVTAARWAAYAAAR